jgi:hypothetical protein
MHPTPPYSNPVPDRLDILAWNLGRLIGLSGSLAFASAARVRHTAERVVWGFDDGWGPPPCRPRCAAIHEYQVCCTPSRGDCCGPCRGCR